MKHALVSIFRPAKGRLGSVRLWSLWLGVALLAACRSTGPLAGALYDLPVEELHVMSMPMALNFDNIPGVDGVAIKVYAVNRSEPKTIPFRRGHLEIDLFDGILQGDQSRTNAALKTWFFEPQELREVEFKTPVGIGYSFTLRWGGSVPRHSKVTLIGRYISPDDQTVYSAPNTIAVSSP